MCIATRCTSVDQFIAMFHRFVDEDSFFVSTVNTRPPGLETSFSVQLADGTPVLRGLCTVLQAWTTAQSPFKTPGVRLGIKRLTANSMPVFERLLVTRSTPQPTPPVPTAALAAGTTVPARPVTVTETTTLLDAPKFADTGPTKIVTRADTQTTPSAAPPKIDIPEVTVEQRTPGSDLILPANPLQNLSDASLEGYVDCTLYEETATFFAVDDDGTPIDDLVPPPAPPTFAPRPVGRISTPVEIVPEPTDEPTFESTFVPPRRAAPTPPPMPVVAAPRADATPPPAPRADATPVPATPVPASLGSSPRADATPPPSPPIAVRADATPAPFPAREPLPVSRESNPSGEIVSVMPAPRGRRGIVIGAGAVAVAAALVAWIALRGGSDPEAAASPTPVPATRPAPVVPTAAAVVEPPPPAPTTDEDKAPSEPEGTSPTAGEGPCQVAVASTPAGSIVHLDGKAIAPSPITIATSCERHKIDLKHPRYQLATKFVALKEGAPGAVDVTLQRPTHEVKVTSQPSGATIFIDGHRAGTTPTVVSVLGFSNLKLEVKKTGYAPISQKLYSKAAQDTVAVKLTKW
jgi:hypothetical protein